MIKYIPQDTQVVFAEVPDEICLGLNLSLCPHHCPGCHSPYLRKDIGEELTPETLDELIEKNSGITCVLFLGGDGDKEELKKLAEYVSVKGLKCAWYSGETDIDMWEFGWFFDYIKVGPYVESLGPLNNPHTNQRLYKICRLYNQVKIMLTDITNKFWKNDNN